MRYAYLFPILCLVLAWSAAADDLAKARSAANAHRFSEARTIWERLSKEGNPDATYNLGRMYARGDGVEQNFMKAKEYFERAADAGHADATSKLGLLYLYGDGVKRDRAMAFYYLRKAEKIGSREAIDTTLALHVPEEVPEPAGLMPPSGAVVDEPEELERAEAPPPPSVEEAKAEPVTSPPSYTIDSNTVLDMANLDDGEEVSAPDLNLADRSVDENPPLSPGLSDFLVETGSAPTSPEEAFRYFMWMSALWFTVPGIL